jgi:bifunctional enzyme CysN/CysC
MAASNCSIAAPAPAAKGDRPPEGLSMLRFLTCGSVDDGKSTLIGRLLHDEGLIFDDTLASLRADSRTFGSTGEEIDLALLVDGLEAEREQGITIDVAYRYIATKKRSFIVADTPGHEQYTRNMVTGASRSDLAVLLVDAQKGLLTQTRRHSCIVHLMGIRHVVLAVNKMDAVNYDAARFAKIRDDYHAFADSLGIADVLAIPISALRGDNVVRKSALTPWYRGPTLLSHLETIEVERGGSRPLRIPVQWVCRPNANFRGYAGRIVSGKMAVGDRVLALPSGRASEIASLLAGEGSLKEAGTGRSVLVTLRDELDIGRGDVLCHAETGAEVADQFAAHLVWMSDEPLLPGRIYVLRCGAQTTTSQVGTLKYKVDVDTLGHVAASKLGLNDIGFCNITTAKPLVFAPYAENRDMGGFIIIDRASNATVGAGMIQFALRRARNIHWQSINISKRQRADIKGQRACCLWFTGLSGSGKSTLANLLEKRLHDLGKHTYILDGDNVRHGLNRDLGFTDADRVENIRRTAEVARLMVDAGLITIVAFISPFRAERRFARERFDAGEFFEVFVDAPLEVCETRDPKGLYARARLGEVKNFTGISSPYEPPLNPEVRLETQHQSPEALVDLLLARMEKGGILGGQGRQ